MILPRRFRELRALAIFAWYCSDEFLKYEILLQLSAESKTPSFFGNKNFENQLLLRLLSQSKEVMLSSLLLIADFSTRELFGTILYDDLLRALGSIKFSKKSTYVRRIIRRKGYRDKGSWRSPDRWIERFDLSFNELQFSREQRKLVFELSFQLLLSKLRQDERKK